MNKSAIYLEKLQVLFIYCPRFKRLQSGFFLLFIFFSATTTPQTQCFSIFNPTVYYTTGHSIVVADILKDLVNLESDVTGIQSPNLGHHATYSLKRKIIFLSLDGTLLLHYKIFSIPQWDTCNVFQILYNRENKSTFIISRTRI